MHICFHISHVCIIQSGRFDSSLWLQQVQIQASTPAIPASSFAWLSVHAPLLVANIPRVSSYSSLLYTLYMYIPSSMVMQLSLLPHRKYVAYGFESTSQLKPFCGEFACSPHDSPCGFS